MRSSASLVPLYRQVSEDLEEKILRGQFAPGEVLPTEYELCRAYDVSRITIRTAIDELVERRLVVRRRGVGTFVSKPEQSIKSVGLTGFIDDVLPLNRLKVVGQKLASPSEAIVQFAGIPAKERIKLIVAVNHIDDKPLSYCHFYFPRETAELIAVADFEGPLAPIRIVEKRLRQRIHHAVQVVEAAIASSPIARRLRLPRGTPVLKILRAYYSASGVLMEIVEAAYHPDRYKFTATLLPRVTGRAISG